MAEQATTTTTEEAPRCRCGSRTDHQCPRPATTTVWGDGPADICEHHKELWFISDDLVQAETAQRMLVMWEEQAYILSCQPLQDAMRFVRAEADLEVARLRREQAELEEEERAGG